jgi:hypothetical protein
VLSARINKGKLGTEGNGACMIQSAGISGGVASAMYRNIAPTLGAAFGDNYIE